MDYLEAYTFGAIGAIVGSIITGFIIGLAPLICGIIKRKIGLAIGGFFACFVAALILGALLALPIAGLFIFLIFKKPKAAKTPADMSDVQQDTAYPQDDNTQQ